MSVQCSFTLVLWRRVGQERDLEFFIPMYGDYMRMMTSTGSGNVAKAARRQMKHQFGVDPRANVRIFVRPDGCYAVFTLSGQEVNLLTKPGAWLPPDLFGSPQLGLTLLDIAQEL